MSALQFKAALTAGQKLQKRQLIARDALALLSLLAITCALFFVTWALFRSFSDHRGELAERWLLRGETALRQGHPAQAVDSLRSALQYSPDRPSIEIELAEALESAGRLQEAAAYFNTLWEAEPGNGKINLAIARLDVQQANENDALRYYQASIDGTWEGDGSVRRRAVRLEMVKYLLARRRYEQAQGELLIAEGNAPNDPVVRLQIAQLLELAYDPADALEIYRSVLQLRPVRQAALEGAGRSAFALGYYLQAKVFLERALNHPDAEKEPLGMREQTRSLLRDSIQILLLYPSDQLTPRARAERILHDRDLVRSRFKSCSESALSVPRPGTSQMLASLALRWRQEPRRPTRHEIERSPQLQQAEMQLVYDTEKITNDQCGTPTGDDAFLMKISRAPNAVDYQ